MYIDKRSPVPAYYQLKSIIIKKVEAGEFSAGNPIPSEREFSENLGISRMTVRQALNQLVNEGVLYRERGKGTFVSKAKIEQRNIMSFSETVRMRGMVPSTKVLQLDREPISQDVAEILEIDKSEFVYNIKRLRMADNIPISIDQTIIPEKFCQGLDRFNLSGSLYRLMKEQFNYVVHHVDNTIEAQKPSKEQRHLLDIASDIPILRIVSVNYTDTGMKLFYERLYYRSDEYKYNVRVYLHRNAN